MRIRIGSAVALAALAILAGCSVDGDGTDPDGQEAPTRPPGEGEPRAAKGSGPDVEPRPEGDPPPTWTIDDLLEPPPPIRIAAGGPTVPGAPAALRVAPFRPVPADAFLFRVGDLRALLSRAGLGRGGLAHPERLIGPVEAALRRAGPSLRPTLPRRPAPGPDGPDPALELVWRERIPAREDAVDLSGPLLEPGAWLWVVRTASHDAFLPIAAGEGALWIHRAGDRIAVAVSGGDGRPESEAEVLVAGAGGRVESIRTDARGLATGLAPGAGPIWVAARLASGIVLARAPDPGPPPPALALSAIALDPEPPAGGSLRILARVQRAGKNGYRPLAGAPVVATLVDRAGFPIATARAATSTAGDALVELELPSSAAPGAGSVRVEAADRAIAIPVRVAGRAPALLVLVEPEGPGWRLRALHASGAPVREGLVELVARDAAGRELERRGGIRTAAGGGAAIPAPPASAARLHVAVRSPGGSTGRAVLELAAGRPALRASRRLLLAGEPLEFRADPGNEAATLRLEGPDSWERTLAAGESIDDRLERPSPGVHRLTLEGPAGSASIDCYVADEAGRVPRAGGLEPAVEVEAAGELFRWIVAGASGSVVLFLDDPTGIEVVRVPVEESRLGEAPLRIGGRLTAAGHDAAGTPWTRRIDLPAPGASGPPAGTTWRSAVHVDPASAFAPIRLEAATAWSRGTAPSAADAYDRARHVENRTALSDDLLFRAVLELQGGRPAEAARLAGEILEIDPFHPGAIDVREKAQAARGDSAPVEAPSIPAADPAARLASTPLSIDLAGRRLESALRDLGRRAGVEIVIDPVVFADPATWDVRLDGLRPARPNAEQVLVAIAARLGLVFRSEGGAIVVTTPAHATQEGLLDAALDRAARGIPFRSDLPEAPAASIAVEIDGFRHALPATPPLALPATESSASSLGAWDRYRVQFLADGQAVVDRKWVAGPARALLAPAAIRPGDRAEAVEVVQPGPRPGPLEFAARPLEPGDAREAIDVRRRAWTGRLAGSAASIPARLDDAERARALGATLRVWTSVDEPLASLLEPAPADRATTAGRFQAILAPVLVLASRRLATDDALCARARELARRAPALPDPTPGGGFGPWPGAAADARSTAGAIEALELAREAGLAVSPEHVAALRRAALRFLDAPLAPESMWRLLALVAGPDLAPEVARRVAATDFDSASGPVLLDAWTAASRAGLADHAALLATRRIEAAVREDGSARWGEEGDPLGDADAVEVTARAVRRLAEAGEEALAREGLAYLMTRRTGESWGNARRDLAVLVAILAAIQADPALPIGDRRATLALEPSALATGSSLPGPDIDFRPAWYVLSVDLAPDGPTGGDGPVAVHWRPLERTGPDGWRALEAADPSRLEAGRPYRCELRLDRPLPAGDYRVTVPVPPGSLVWAVAGPAGSPAAAPLPSGDLAFTTWVRLEEGATEAVSWLVVPTARGRFDVPGPTLALDGRPEFATTVPAIALVLAD